MPQIARLALAVALLGAALAFGCTDTTPTCDAANCGVPAIPSDAAVPTIRAVVNQQYAPVLFDLLAEAKKTVRVIHLYINPDSSGDEVVKYLGEAVARGVEVTVQVEDSVDSSTVRVKELVALGVEAKVDSSDVFSHAKLVVVDGEQALLGSTNISASSMTKNNEANVWISDPQLAAYFDEYAKGLLENSTSRPKPEAVSNLVGTALSDGSYVDHASEMISGAKARIILVVYGMNIDDRYPDSDIHKLVDKLSQAARRGVSVRVILEQADYNASVNELNQDAAKKLKAEGIEVRADALSQITHAKVLLADDEVIVGSNNWGYGGFTLYHEVGVRTGVAEVVDDLAVYLNRIWKEGASF